MDRQGSKHKKTQPYAVDPKLKLGDMLRTKTVDGQVDSLSPKGLLYRKAKYDGLKNFEIEAGIKPEQLKKLIIGTYTQEMEVVGQYYLARFNMTYPSDENEAHKQSFITLLRWFDFLKKSPQNLKQVIEQGNRFYEAYIKLLQMTNTPSDRDWETISTKL